jgi:uncharacterized YccA/Bax inhibitor family protein
MLRSGNPTLNERAFAPPIVSTAPDAMSPTATVSTMDRMSVEGVVYKTALLVLLCALAAAFTWSTTEPVRIGPGLLALTFFGLIGTGIATAVRPRIAIVTGPVYALASGAFIGVVSSFFEARYPGIAQQAALGTVMTLAGMLFAYRTGLIRATPRFVRIVVSATLGIMLLYVVSIGMRFVGMQMPLLHDSGPLGIAISVGIVAIAALNLILDFAFIEGASARGAEKRMEWYGAFALLVTLVWLYLELLRLLAKLRE